MENRELAEALQLITELEARVHASWAGATRRQDLVEADQSLVTYRLARPLKRQLETWMNTRACRAALQPADPAA